MKYVIGSDLGTSGVKTLLFDQKGNIICFSHREYGLKSLKTGWAEQSPQEWWKAAAETFSEVMQKSGIKPSEIAGIGLSGQMHGLVMLDREGNVLRDSIIWCDQRSSEQCKEIQNKIGLETLISITGNPALTGFTLSKLLWVMKNEPDIYKKCRHILLPKDYIRYKLTGKFATDVSDAGGMQMLDLRERKWSDKILVAFGINKSLLPEVFESADVTGWVHKKAAEESGLPEGVIVSGGAGDQAAAAIGNGIVRGGLVSCNIGSSGVIFAHTDKLTIDAKMRIQTLCHSVRNSWHMMGVTQCAGMSLKWFRDNFYEGYQSSYAKLDQDVENCPIGSGGIYLPYLMGERSPHLDPYARGVFFGLDNTSDKGKMARAVMEGVTFSLKECLDAIEQQGINFSEIRLCGGGSGSKVWRQMAADVFGLPVRLTSSQEAGALGVAILAAEAAGIYPDEITACDNMVSLGDLILPDKQHLKEYQKYYKVYRRLYPILKVMFRRYSKLY
jgi:xylulokinase